MCGGPLKCGGPCSAEHVRTLVNPALVIVKIKVDCFLRHGVIGSLARMSLSKQYRLT